MLRDRGSARVTFLVALLVVLVAALCVLAVLDAFPRLGGTTQHWQRLSLISDVFSNSIGVLTVVAIAVAAGAFVYQHREHRLQVAETRAVREQGIRTEHRELMFKALDDPFLLAVWGGSADPAMRDDDQRLLTYANQIVSFWQMAYDSGRMSAAELRNGAREFFTGRIGRAYWKGAHGDRESAAMDSTERRFHAIVAEEYAEAVKRPPAPDKLLVPVRPAGSGPSLAVVGGVAGLAVAVAAGYVLGRRSGW